MLFDSILFADTIIKPQFLKIVIFSGTTKARGGGEKRGLVDISLSPDRVRPGHPRPRANQCAESAIDPQETEGAKARSAPPDAETAHKNGRLHV